MNKQFFIMLSIFICFLSTLPFMALIGIPHDKIHHYSVSFAITYFLFYFYKYLIKQNKQLFFFVFMILLFIPISLFKEYTDSLQVNNYFDYYDIIANYTGCFVFFIFYSFTKGLNNNEK